MVDNFSETLNAIRRFIYSNVPAGIEYEKLERLIESQTHYFPLEFKREGASCTLYVELDGFYGEFETDEQGNRYSKVKLTANPSWPSYGSVDLEDAKRFAQLVSEVVAFAESLLKQFPEPFFKLSATAAEIARNCRRVMPMQRE
jgi:hypothetical protein